MRLAYRSGYDHVTEDVYQCETGIFGHYIVLKKHLSLNVNGILTIGDGYAWDGASWAVDTPSFIRPSLVHDALYQLMRDGNLPQSYRKHVDELLMRHLKEDGMWAIRRAWVWAAVRFGGGLALLSEKPILYSPDPEQ